MLFFGPYFEIIIFLELELVIVRFRITRFQAWIVPFGRINVTCQSISFLLNCIGMGIRVLPMTKIIGTGTTSLNMTKRGITIVTKPSEVGPSKR